MRLRQRRPAATMSAMGTGTGRLTGNLGRRQQVESIALHKTYGQGLHTKALHGWRRHPTTGRGRGTHLNRPSTTSTHPSIISSAIGSLKLESVGKGGSSSGAGEGGTRTGSMRLHQVTLRSRQHHDHVPSNQASAAIPCIAIARPPSASFISALQAAGDCAFPFVTWSDARRSVAACRTS